MIFLLLAHAIAGKKTAATPNKKKFMQRYFSTHMHAHRTKRAAFTAHSMQQI